MVIPSLPSHFVMHFRFQLNFSTGKRSSNSHGAVIHKYCVCYRIYCLFLSLFPDAGTECIRPQGKLQRGNNAVAEADTADNADTSDLDIGKTGDTDTGKIATVDTGET